MFLKLYDSTLFLLNYNYFKNASILWYLIIIFRSPCSHIIKKGIYYNKNIQDRFFMVLHVGKIRGKMFKIKDVPTGKAFTTSLFPWNSQFYCSSSLEFTSCNQIYHNCQQIYYRTIKCHTHKNREMQSKDPPLVFFHT